MQSVRLSLGKVLVALEYFHQSLRNFSVSAGLFLTDPQHLDSQAELVPHTNSWICLTPCCPD